MTGRQFGGLLTVPIPTRTYAPSSTKRSKVTTDFQRWYSISQLQEIVRSVHPLSATENLSPTYYRSTLSSAEYHAFSDETMETLLSALEVLVDSGPDPNFEVEYSVSC